MIKFIKDAWRGAGYLEGYGDHPGTGMLIVFILMGGITGMQRGGLWGFLDGCLIMVLCFGPLWIAGCIGRARSYDRYNNKEEQI